MWRNTAFCCLLLAVTTEIVVYGQSRKKGQKPSLTQKDVPQGKTTFLEFAMDCKICFLFFQDNFQRK